jgi:hypothetical protein
MWPWIEEKMTLLTCGLIEMFVHVAMAVQSMGTAGWSLADEGKALRWRARPIGTDG